MKIELDNQEIGIALEQYLQNTFSVSADITDFKVVAGRTGGESRIELNVSLGSDKKCFTGALPVEYAKSASLEQLTGETDEEDEDLVEPIQNLEPSEDIAEEVPVLKATTDTPLVESELKPLPGSFFSSNK